MISNSSGPFQRIVCEFGPVRSGPFREIVDPTRNYVVISSTESVTMMLALILCIFASP